MTSVTLVQTLAMLALNAQPPLDAPKEGCVLEVRAVDALWVAIERAEVRIPGSQPWFESDTPRDVPCSARRMTVYARGFRPKNADVMLSPGYNLRIVQLDVGLDGGPITFSPLFLIRGYDELRSCDAVRVVSLLEPTRRWDTKVSHRGGFLIQDMPMGTYSFLLIGSGGTCGSTTLDIRSKPDAETTLDFVNQAVAPATELVDKRCSGVDCATLSIVGRRVFFEMNGGISNRVEIGKHDLRAARPLPATEAGLKRAKTRSGWSAVASAFLPQEFEIEPGVRLRIVDPRGRVRTIAESQMFLSFLQAGDLLGNGTELVVFGTTGPHAYVVETKAWYLSEGADPRLVLDCIGLPDSFQRANGSQPAGVWLDIQTYDGIDAATKGLRRQFVKWDAQRMAFNDIPGCTAIGK